MTPDQIKEAAIEAAFKVAHEKGYGIPYLVMRAAIKAYEAAMWTTDGPKDGSKTLAFTRYTGVYLSKFKYGEWPMRDLDMDGIWYPQPTHFRPLPQFAIVEIPEGK